MMKIKIKCYWRSLLKKRKKIESSLTFCVCVYLYRIMVYWCGENAIGIELIVIEICCRGCRWHHCKSDSTQPKYVKGLSSSIIDIQDLHSRSISADSINPKGTQINWKSSLKRKCPRKPCVKPLIILLIIFEIRPFFPLTKIYFNFHLFTILLHKLFNFLPLAIIVFLSTMTFFHFPLLFPFNLFLIHFPIFNLTFYYILTNYRFYYFLIYFNILL